MINDCVFYSLELCKCTDECKKKVSLFSSEGIKICSEFLYMFEKNKESAIEEISVKYRLK